MTIAKNASLEAMTIAVVGRMDLVRVVDVLGANRGRLAEMTGRVAETARGAAKDIRVRRVMADLVSAVRATGRLERSAARAVMIVVRVGSLVVKSVAMIAVRAVMIVVRVGSLVVKGAAMIAARAVMIVVRVGSLVVKGAAMIAARAVMIVVRVGSLVVDGEMTAVRRFRRMRLSVAVRRCSQRRVLASTARISRSLTELIAVSRL